MASAASPRSTPTARRLAGASVIAAVCALFGVGPAAAKPAKHKVKKPRVEHSEDWSSAKAAQYGAMDKTKCLAELRGRKVPFKALTEAKGVLAPVRLTGPLGGVTYRTEAKPEERKESPYEVMDCRLVLSLSDLSPILRKHKVSEVLMFSVWRPPGPGWPADKIGIRHPGALAIDIRAFVLDPPDKQDEQDKPEGEKLPKELVVLRDWPAKRGEKPCEKPPGGSDAHKVLRRIFCEADEAKIFNAMLSPNYDGDHANHFHLEVRPGVTWRLVL